MVYALILNGCFR